MSLSIPAAARDQHTATVRANVPLCREHYRLVLHLPAFAPTRPGQFVQVSCRQPASLAAGSEPAELEWTPGERLTFHDEDLLMPTALLRRPFSLAGRRDLPDGSVELDLIHRVVGIGTHWLSQLEAGDEVGLLGPLGNTFALPAPGQTAVLVGGGVGIPPMLYLAGALAGFQAIAFCGALTRDLLPLMLTTDASPDAEPQMCIGEFAQHRIRSVVTTDDGSYGFRGFVTQALERWLDRQGFGVRAQGAGGASAASTGMLRPVLYTCGPELMMKRVAEIAAGRGLECQVAVERAMACGMGTCQSCCIRVRKPDPSRPPMPGSDWCYRLACTDGPVFAGRDLLW